MVYYENHHILGKEIPMMGGIEGRTLLGGVAAGTLRACIETPFEFAKVRKQTGQDWNYRDCYKGFSAMLPRTVGLLVSFCCMLHMVRKKTELMNTPTGQFFTTGFMAMSAWWFVWPFEFVKN